MKSYVWVIGIIFTIHIIIPLDAQTSLAIKINNHQITKADVFDLYLKRYHNDANDVLREILYREMIELEKVRENINISSEEIQGKVNEELANLENHVKVQYQMTLEAFLAKKNTSLKNYLDQAQYRWRNRLFMEYLVRIYELRQERALIRYIVANEKSKALDLLQLLRKGRDFSEIVRGESVESSEDGKSPIWVYKGDFSTAPEFENLVFTLKDGEVGGPIQTQAGLFLIVRVEKYLKGNPYLNWEKNKQEVIASIKENNVSPKDIKRWVTFVQKRYQVNYLWENKGDDAIQIEKRKISKAEVLSVILNYHHKDCMEVVKELIYRFIIQEEMKKEGISVQPNEIDKGVEEEIEQYKTMAQKETNKTWEEILQSEGTTEQELKKDLEEKHFYKIALERLVRLSQLRYDSVLVRQITLQDQKQAEEIRDKLIRHADFDALARQKSIWAQSQGGRLPKIYRGDYPKEMGLDELLFSMKEGEISPIHKTRMGFHIFQLKKNYPGRKGLNWILARDEVIQSLKSEPVLPQDIERWRRLVQKDYTIENFIND